MTEHHCMMMHHVFPVPATTIGTYVSPVPGESRTGVEYCDDCATEQSALGVFLPDGGA